MSFNLPSLAGLVNRLHPHTRGWLAEYVALVYLGVQGYRPARRFWRTRVQTDLVLTRGTVMVLVEVKFRQTAAHAAVAITPTQAARLRAEARRIAARHPAYTVRADAVQVFPAWPFVHHSPALIALD